MSRVRSLALLLAPLFAIAAPARAQMSFQGLDLSDDSKPPAKRKKRKKQRRDRRRGQPAAVSPPAPASAPAPTMMPGLDLSGSPAASPASVHALAPPPAPALVLPGLKVGATGATRVRLASVAKEFRAGHFPDAAVTAYAALEEAGDPTQSAEAEYLLAKSLFKMKMYHAALHHFSRVLARGEGGKFFKPSLEWLFFISRKTLDEGIVLEDVARWANVEFPVRYQSEFRYLLARYYMTRAEALIQAGQIEGGKAALGTVQGLVERVPKGTPYYAKARFLAGTAAYQGVEAGLAASQVATPQSLAPALERFKEVVRVTNPRAPGTLRDWRTRDLAFMDLARIHYEAHQNRNAIYYYGKVSRGGEQWLEALYEAAWSYYRLGDDERALGTMVTLHAPFFKDEYFPESLTVKAIIYYENCRYGEALAAIDEFDRIYGPVHEELKKITARDQPAEAFYELLDQIQKRQRKQGSSPLLDRILKLALSDEGLRRRNGSIQELDAEIAEFSVEPNRFRYSDLAKVLLGELQAERVSALSQAGQIARAKLEEERDDLKDLLGKALRIKFETQEKEKELLELKLAGRTNHRNTVHAYRFSGAVPAKDEAWPYEGEYWRDELGSYQYNLTKGCRVRTVEGTR